MPDNILVSSFRRIACLPVGRFCAKKPASQFSTMRSYGTQHSPQCSFLPTKCSFGTKPLFLQYRYFRRGQYTSMKSPGNLSGLFLYSWARVANLYKTHFGFTTLAEGWQPFHVWCHSEIAAGFFISPASPILHV